MSEAHVKSQIVVIGAGPGGYAAAFRAADHGLQVTLIDGEKQPGGVCLYRGCIPSKALLHVASLLSEARHAARWGITFGRPAIDLDALRAWKNRVISQLTSGLGQLCKQRKISYIQGLATFIDPRNLQVMGPSGKTMIEFEKVIIATGSRPVNIFNGSVMESPHLWNSTTALELREIPESLLVIGGGYIGLEMGSVYAALGSRVTVVEMTPELLPGADADLVRPLAKRLGSLFASVELATKVVGIEKADHGLEVVREGPQGKKTEVFAKVLVSVGRKPNSSGFGLERTQVKLDAKGFIEVNGERRTAEPHIYAIGDVAGQPGLAHKASHEAFCAVDSLLGKPVSFEPQAIPAVVFTDPEIAWCGLTEAQAQSQGRKVEVVRFPWAASGRALTLDRTDGLTKIIVDPETEQVLGVGLCGPHAGDLISEGVLAMEMGATVSDLALTIHPHPTLSETLMEASEIFFGHCTHMYRPKKPA